MLNIAILAGGPSAERGISLKSAETIAKHLPSDKYNSVIIDVMPGAWKAVKTGQSFSVNQFSLVDDSGKPTERFDFAFIIIHGTPAEDGLLQGFLQMMGIPHSACGVGQRADIQQTDVQNIFAHL